MNPTRREWLRTAAVAPSAWIVPAAAPPGGFGAEGGREVQSNLPSMVEADGRLRLDYGEGFDEPVLVRIGRGRHAGRCSA